MKKITALLLTLALLSSFLVIPSAAANPSFSIGKTINIKSKTGLALGDYATHGNHQTRTVHTSHGEYAAYVTGTYTDSKGQTVNKWTLFKINASTGAATAIFTGEKYFDSSQVSLLVDKNENVWAITANSDAGRNQASEAIDCKAYRLDAKTGEITSYFEILGGGARDGYGYATCFYDQYKNRIIVMLAGGDYVAGQNAASFNWTIFDCNTNQWQSRVRSAKINSRHCYMFGYIDEKGGLMLLAQRDIKAASLGYPEIGVDTGLNYAEQQYMKENGITRWSANYCWDQLDLYYFPNILYSNYVTYSVCEADYSRVYGTQEERYTLIKRLSNYYPNVMNNNGGDFLLTETADGKKLLHITYNKAFIQAAMNRSKGVEATWYYQVWDVTDGSNAKMRFNGPIMVEDGIADDMLRGGGFCFRIYEDTYGNVNLVSAHNGALSIYRTAYDGKGNYNFHKVGSTVTLSGAGDLLNISSQRGGSITDNKINILYSSSGSYVLTQVTLSPAQYEEVPCAHKYTLSKENSIPLTCTTNGLNYSICDYCKETKTEELIATGHKLSTTSQNVTCTTDGYTKTECSDCDYEELITYTAPGHKIVETVVDPTCTENGYKKVTCENCTYTAFTSLPKTDHNYVGGLCTDCGARDGDFQVIAGDLNGDGYITASDINILKRIVAGTLNASTLQMLAADINGSGEVTALDSNLLARKVAGVD